MGTRYHKMLLQFRKMEKNLYSMPIISTKIENIKQSSTMEPALLLPPNNILICISGQILYRFTH